MKSDLISVIVPIYRVEKYLEQCIQSIRNQTYRNLEIILVDDGSDDGCPVICDRHAEEDRRIKVIHKENGGLDSAKKAGILAATGKYVGYVDGDDWIEPVMYEKLLGYMYKYDVDVVDSGVIDSWVDRENYRTSYIEEGCYKGKDFIDKVEPRLLYSGIFFRYGIEPYVCSKLILRESLLEYQLKEDLVNVIHDDTMVALPCIAKLKNIYVSHECYYHYRVRTDSLKRHRRQDEIGDLRECYPQICDRFKDTLLRANDDKQIREYALYWLLYKTPLCFDDASTNCFLRPFGNVEMNARIVLYGAGAAGIHLKEGLQVMPDVNLVCWADRNYKDLQRTLEVVAPEEIIQYEYDYIIISILRESAVQSAKKDLVALGVPENRIKWIEQKYIDDPNLLLNKVL